VDHDRAALLAKLDALIAQQDALVAQQEAIATTLAALRAVIADTAPPVADDANGRRLTIMQACGVVEQVLGHARSYHTVRGWCIDKGIGEKLPSGGWLVDEAKLRAYLDSKGNSQQIQR
jgi:hypothetical protein